MAILDRADAFLASVRESFEAILGAERIALTDFYVEVPAKHRSLKGGKALEGGTARLVPVDPFIFASGFWDDPLITATSAQTSADPGFLGLVLGAYGNGKSELIYQLCHFLDRNRKSSSVPRIMPINLGSCRRHLSKVEDKAPSWRDFASLILTQKLEEAGEDMGFVEHILRPAIQEGEILLALDALDELSFDGKTYTHFFAGLRAFLGIDDESSPSHFRVLVSMRLEYQATMDPDYRGLIRNFNPLEAPGISQHLLMLDFFGKPQIRYYLNNRCAGDKFSFRAIEKNLKLLDTLRRPLLLRIFGDLIQDSPPEVIATLITEVEAPAHLIQLYVERASEEMVRDQQALFPYTWDNRRLARQSVKLFRNKRSNFKIDDLPPILNSFAHKDENLETLSLSEQDCLQGIHKCPFLLRSDSGGEPRVRFAHRSFLEYFTAQGLVDGLMEKIQREEMPRSRDIDELVLNVDMRKFLRDLIELSQRRTKLSEMDFEAITRRSYGLEGPPENWNLPEGTSYEEIQYSYDRHRIRLMYAMTDPEDPMRTAGIQEEISWLLSKDFREFYPGYLIYNYESVAVFITYHRWSPEGQRLRQEFSKVAQSCFDWCREILTPRGAKRSIRPDLHPRKEALRPVFERLLERLLDIALRMRWRWVQFPDMVDQERQLLKLIGQGDTRSRVKSIIGNIRVAVFGATPKPKSSLWRADIRSGSD